MSHLLCDSKIFTISGLVAKCNAVLPFYELTVRSKLRQIQSNSITTMGSRTLSLALISVNLISDNNIFTICLLSLDTAICNTVLPF